ncbi:hypothetical protein KIL84_000486 [Mauremys mutica]|uniref:Uncharacterized protein n=1 Tax=Mauremys mutica TaxID=74926 RepID=A0A9D4AUW0_9SAUR|nr:hypothetical protein KIL84_000486 [Mauremys mutica]
MSLQNKDLDRDHLLGFWPVSWQRDDGWKKLLGLCGVSLCATREKVTGREQYGWEPQHTTGKLRQTQQQELITLSSQRRLWWRWKVPLSRTETLEVGFPGHGAFICIFRS